MSVTRRFEALQWESSNSAQEGGTEGRERVNKPGAPIVQVIYVYIYIYNIIIKKTKKQLGSQGQAWIRSILVRQRMQDKGAQCVTGVRVVVVRIAIKACDQGLRSRLAIKAIKVKG